MSLRVELLGGLRITVGDRSIEPRAWSRKHVRGLIAQLALTPGHRLHREQLVDQLWPDLPPDAAARNLRKALHIARRTLSDDPLEAASSIVGESGTLSLPSDVWVDVEAFETALARARRADDPAAYDVALQHHGGELLPEDRYEPWVVTRQEELRAEYVAALSEQAAAWESRGELDLAAEALVRAIAEAPLDEELASRLMRVRALAGRRTEALEGFERLREALDRDLAVEPAPATQRLKEEIATGGLSATLTWSLWERIGDLRMLSGDLTGAALAFASGLGAAPAAGLDAARLHRKAAEAHLGVHDVGGAAPHLAAASMASDDAAEAARLAVLEVAAAWERGDLDGAAASAPHAMEVAEATGDEHAVAAAHEAMAVVHHLRGAWREGLREEVERLRHLPDDEQELARVFDIHHCIGQYHLYGDGLWEGVEAYARETLDQAERIGAVRAQAFAWCLLGESLLLQARFDEAAGCLERSGELHASLGTRSGALAWQRLAELMVCAGEPEGAPGHLRRASSIATVSPMARHLWGRIHATSALAAVVRGDAAGAVRSVRAAAAAAARSGDCPTCSALLHPVAAEAYAILGLSEEARHHVEAAGAVADMFDSSAWRAMALSARASLHVAEGDVEDARHLFEQAGAHYERAGQPFWAARARSMTP